MNIFDGRLKSKLDSFKDIFQGMVDFDFNREYLKQVANDHARDVVLNGGSIINDPIIMETCKILGVPTRDGKAVVSYRVVEGFTPILSARTFVYPTNHPLRSNRNVIHTTQVLMAEPDGTFETANTFYTPLKETPNEL